MDNKDLDGRCAVSAAPGCQPSGPQPATPSSQSGTPNAGDWIEWLGGKCLHGLVVDAKLRDGYVFESIPSDDLCSLSMGEDCSSVMCNWQHDGGDLDVVSYRVVGPVTASGVEARSDATPKSGAAEGESPAPEGGDAQ